MRAVVGTYSKWQFIARACNFSRQFNNRSAGSKRFTSVDPRHRSVAVDTSAGAALSAILQLHASVNLSDGFAKEELMSTVKLENGLEHHSDHGERLTVSYANRKISHD